MVTFKSVAIALILLQTSFMVINLTGIFPVHEEITTIDEKKITLEKNNILDKSQNPDNALDYFKALGSAVTLGLELMGTFLNMIFSAVPSILKIFYVPAELADKIGFAVDAIIILAIAWKLFSRGG